jgi:hypothetical protein
MLIQQLTTRMLIISFGITNITERRERSIELATNLQNKNRKTPITTDEEEGEEEEGEEERQQKHRKEGKGLWKGELNLEFDDLGFYQLQKDLTKL